MRQPSYNDFLQWAIKYRPKDHPVWKYNAKTAGRDFATRLGIPVPELLAGPGDLRSLPFPDRPFVIKPVNGAGSRGVLPLEPTDSGTHYLDLFRDQVLNRDEAIATAYASRRPKPTTPKGEDIPWIIEEMVVEPDGSLTYDWKFWVIGGRVELIWQSDRNGGGGRSRAVKWWTPEWESAGDVAPHEAIRFNATLPKPRFPDELIAAAEQVGENVAGPMIRVDLYDTPDGVMFGEITPHPFGATIPFGPEWDKRLGKAWLRTGVTM